jgi:hypothetical protein
MRIIMKTNKPLSPHALAELRYIIGAAARDHGRGYRRECGFP